MTREMVEDGVKPSVRGILWFVGYLSVTCRDSASTRWHKGCQEEFKTRARGMGPMQAWSLVDPARPCGSSVDPIQSAVRKQSAKKGNINQGKGEAKQYHRKGENAPPPIRERGRQHHPRGQSSTTPRMHGQSRSTTAQKGEATVLCCTSNGAGAPFLGVFFFGSVQNSVCASVRDLCSRASRPNVKHAHFDCHVLLDFRVIILC